VTGGGPRVEAVALDAADVACAGWISAVTVPTPSSRSHPTMACAASVAKPRPWWAVPITQASSATGSASTPRTVACTYPIAVPVARRRTTQLSQTADPSGGPPLTWTV
jgi:hypothetical protein